MQQRVRQVRRRLSEAADAVSADWWVPASYERLAAVVGALRAAKAAARARPILSRRELVAAVDADKAFRAAAKRLRDAMARVSALWIEGEDEDNTDETDDDESDDHSEPAETSKILQADATGEASAGSEPSSPCSSTVRESSPTSPW